MLVFSGEYSTGMIRRCRRSYWSRLLVLWAKVIVLVGLVPPATLLGAFLDYFAAAAIESFAGSASP